MSFYKLPWRRAILLTLAGCVSLLTFSAAAKTPEPPGLFSQLPDTAKATPKLPRQAIAGKSRAVKINYGQLRSGRIFLSLPGDISFEAVRELQQDLGNGRFAWVGHASDDPDGINNAVVIAVSGNAVAGSFAYHGKLFKLEPRADGSHVLSEVKTTQPAPEHELPPPQPGSLSAAEAISSPSSSLDSGSAATTSQGPVIDLLVAYTPAVQLLYGTAGTEALILQAVAETNKAYSTSAMVVRLNLVGSVLINYTSSGDMVTDLGRLQATNDGYTDEIHTLRNSYKADLVSLIGTGDGVWCGVGYNTMEGYQGYPSWGFSLVAHDCATGYYVFAHEIGHNQGAQHDIAHASSTPAFPYAYGYQDPLNRFRTIMAYDCPGGCDVVGVFSNSALSVWGVPFGQAGATENATAIDQTAPIVASFRQQSTPQLPSAPANLGASGVSPRQINLNWADTCAIESGFVVERSTDNLNFTQIVSLPANSSSYFDTNLPPSTSYYYRTRAWNSDGSSPYSGVATAATQAPPPYIDQLVSSEWSGGGKVSGTFQNTKSKDGVMETITEVQSGGVKSKRYSYLEQYWGLTVQPGQSVTLYADVSTTATQSFTFAYSTSSASLTVNKAGWIDMFSVSSSNSAGTKQFTLPANLSGPVYISVRDNSRVAGVTTTNSVKIDYLAIRTNFGG